MALYRYVGSKNGLADLMADQVYGQLTVIRGDGWRPALRGLGRSGWDAVQRHPWQGCRKAAQLMVCFLCCCG
jgi:hypothetical protein